MKPLAFLIVPVLAIAVAHEAVPQEKKPDNRGTSPVKRHITLKGHQGRVGAVQFAPGGMVLASGGWDGTLVLWDVAKEKKLGAMKEDGRWWGPLAFSPDSKTLLAGHQSGIVKLWDVGSRKEKDTLKGHRGIIQLVSFIDNGKTLVTGDQKGRVTFRNPTTGEKREGQEMEVGNNLSLAITTDGKTLVSTGTFDDADKIKVWDVSTKKLRTTLRGHQGGITALALSPDGKTLVSAAFDRVPRVWDLPGAKERAKLIGHTNDIFSVTVAADDKSVVTGSLDGTVKVWDLATGGEPLALEPEPNTGMIVSVCISADGKMVAAGHTDKAVSLWHLAQNVSALAPKEVVREKPRLTAAERRAMDTKAEALAAQGRKGAEALAKELDAGNHAWKIAALIALRSMGPDANPAVESVGRVLKSQDFELRRLAAGTLKAIGPQAKAAVPALIEAAKETKDFTGSFSLGGASNVAEAALEAVRAIDSGAMPQLAKATIPGLLEVIGKGRTGSPENALALLRQLGPHAKPALPKLKELLTSMPVRSLRDCTPVFLVGEEEGAALLADFLLDAKTSSEIRVAMLDGYRWERTSFPSTVRMLRGLLADKSPAVRAAAIQVLESVRAKEIIPKLAALLDDQEVVAIPSDLIGADRFHVARALANQGKDAVPLLQKALNHKVPLARFQAARALAGIGKDARDAGPALEKALDDSLPVIQLEAARALLRSGKESPKALKKLKDFLQGEAPLRRAALEALAEMGKPGLALFPTVKKLVLESGDPSVQRAGFRAIRGMQADPKEIVEIWAALLPKQPAFLHFPPTDEIRTYGKEAQPALPALLEYLNDRDVNTRRRTVEALTAMGPAAEKAIPALIKALDGDSFVAHGAMEALGAMGSRAKPAVAPLVRNFEKTKPDDREASYHQTKILTALEQIGPGAVEAVPRLLEWLPAHERAIRVLGKIGPGAKAAVPVLEKIYGTETGYRKTWSAFALVKITGKTEPYVKTLAATFQKGKNPERRREALEALVELGPDARAALPAFLMALKEKGERGFSLRDNRHDAAKALVHFGPVAKEAVPYLIDMVKTSYFAAKIAAAEALWRYRP